MGRSQKDLAQEKPIFEQLDQFQISIVSPKKKNRNPSTSPKKNVSNVSIAEKKEAKKKVLISLKSPSERLQAFSKVIWPQFVRKWSKFQIRWHKKFRMTALTKVSPVSKKSVSPSPSASLTQPQKVSQEPLTDLEWFFSTPALFFYGMFALCYLGAFYSQPILDKLRGTPELQIQLNKPQWVCRSPWTEQLPLWSSLESLPHQPFLFEKKLLPQLQHIFEKSAWLKKVEVQRVFPNRIRVVAQVRRPCLAIRFGEQTIFVDREGVRVPYIPEAMAELLVLEGVQTPPPKIGECWNEPGLNEVCQLAQFFKKQNIRQWVPLESIRFEVNSASSENLEKIPDCSFILKTIHQTEIYWGRSENSPYVHTANASKLRLLQQFCKQYPELKGLKLADLRFEEESFVCISQTN